MQNPKQNKKVQKTVKANKEDANMRETTNKQIEQEQKKIVW